MGKTVKHPHQVDIHPHSMHKMMPKMVLYHELVLTTKEFMRNVIEIKPEWLMDVAPHYFEGKDLGYEGKQSKNKGTAATGDAGARKCPRVGDGHPCSTPGFSTFP